MSRPPRACLGASTDPIKKKGARTHCGAEFGFWIGQFRQKPAVLNISVVVCLKERTCYFVFTRPSKGNYGIWRGESGVRSPVQLHSLHKHTSSQHAQS